MKAELARLIDAISRTRHYLVQHGEAHASGRLGGLEERLAREDKSAVVSAISEATGGMGSLNDYQFGDARDSSLRALVSEVEQGAREAARVLAVPLVR